MIAPKGGLFFFRELSDFFVYQFLNFDFDEFFLLDSFY